MTIDEAIKYCEEVAEENEKNAKSINNIYKKSCLECAKKYRQLAEWLRELKAYREFADWLVKAVLEDDWGRKC